MTDEVPRLTMTLPQSNTDLIARYRDYYQEEQHLNIMLVFFVQNLTEAYGGVNTVEHQLGYPLEKEYTSLNGDDALPLGKEFQELVAAFIGETAEEPTERYKNVSLVINQIHDALHFHRASERDKIRQMELITKNLQVLRGIIHNEIVKIPEDSSGKKAVEEQEEVVEEIQNALVEMNILEAILNHISSSSEEVAREVLALLSAVLYGGNDFVQERFMKIWLSSREEPFFSSIKARMAETEEAIKERRLGVDKNITMKLKEKKELKESTDKSAKQENMFDMFAPKKPAEKAQTIFSTVSSFFFGAETESGTAEEPGIKRARSRANQNVRRDSYGASFVIKPGRREPLLNPAKLENEAIQTDFGFQGLIQNVSLDMIQNISIQAMKEVVVDDAIEEATQFKDPGHLDLVLRVLAGLCDGQNTKVQDYLRDQFDNLKNIDIVGETANFLALVYGSINCSSIETVTQLLDSLIEMVQGNEANQVVVFDRKAIDYLNHMLRMEDVSGCSAEQIWSLKKSIGILITDMTEANTASGHTKMIMEAVGKDDIANVMMTAFDQLNGHKLDPEIGDLVMNVGFNYHHILCRAFDLDPKIDISKYDQSDAWKYFMNHTLSIEIQQGDNLQRVYFTVEDKEVLRESVKERLKWEVDRSSPSNKLRSFMDWAREVCSDIRYQRKVQSITMCRMLVNNWSLLNVSVLLLTFILNLVVLFGWVAPEGITQIR